MENDDQILQEMERDALRQEQEKAELAMFNIIEATNELKRIGAEGSVPSSKSTTTSCRTLLRHLTGS